MLELVTATITNSHTFTSTLTATVTALPQITPTPISVRVIEIPYNLFDTFFGPLLGVIVGSLITILIEWIKEKKNKKEKQSKLVEELIDVTSTFELQLLEYYQSKLKLEANYRISEICMVSPVEAETLRKTISFAPDNVIKDNENLNNERKKLANDRTQYLKIMMVSYEKLFGKNEKVDKIFEEISRLENSFPDFNFSDCPNVNSVFEKQKEYHSEVAKISKEILQLFSVLVVLTKSMIK